MQGPNPREIELSLFGRGYGEALLLHLGDGHWIQIDSFRDRERRVAPLRYLAQIGVRPEDSLRLVVATHWHDDHVEGLSEVYERARLARLAMPAAMRSAEVTAFRGRARRGGSERFSSGVDELDKIAVIRDRDSRGAILLAGPNQILLRYSEHELGHRQAIDIESLSPSPADVQSFIQATKTVPELPPGNRVEPFKQNDASVALWVRVGRHRILLGADLENVNDPARGWNAVLSSPAHLDGQAAVIKVPHHGSKNGHHPDVWSRLLKDGPTAVLTTWNRGSKLPSSNDVTRIMGLTSSAYITTRMSRKSARRVGPVESTLQEARTSIRARPAEVGHIRLRLDLGSTDPVWQTELLGDAVQISELLA